MANCTSRVCIQAKKVFDACLKQASIDTVSITLRNLNPQNPTLPLTFVGGRSMAVNAEIENLVVTRLPDKPRYGRVQADVVIPISIAYTDANNVAGTGVGTLTVHQDVIMLLPEASIMPYQIEASVSVVIPNATFDATGENYTFMCNTCVSVILKIIINVELIVPTYGYAVIPACKDYNSQVCSGFFDLPLFPEING